jgi:hypothetical protein
MLFSIVPVSGQTVSDLTVQISNTAGSISACPVTINFVATIAMNFPAATPAQGRSIQYKWTNSSGIDEPTQTATFVAPALVGAGMDMPSIQLKNSWKVNAGTYWEALQISYPVNLNAPQRAYVVTCPTLGTLSLPVTVQNGGMTSPAIIRP